ncbi:ABC transporter substrate-binding protein [soil metagenome]
MGTISGHRLRLRGRDGSQEFGIIPQQHLHGTGSRLASTHASSGSIWLVLLLLLSACSSGPATQAPERASEDTTGPVRAEVLRISLPQDFGPINLFGQHEEPLTELIYDKLLAPSPYVEDPQPWLAREVTQIDNTTWEVSVRDDVSWHDGEAFTAEDVVFTFDYFRTAPTGRWTHHVSDVPDVTAAVTEAGTVRLVCAFPCPELGSVTLADLPILPQHVWQDVTEPREATFLPVGTGPYELTSYDSATGYTFIANAGYFAGRPMVEELSMPIIPDPSTAFAALRTGELDAVARPLPPELLEDFGQEPSIKIVTTAPLEYPELRLNYEREPFDDPLVRRAVSLAIDKETLLEVALLGQGRPATQGYPHPDSPWTNPDLSTPYDPSAAAALLDEAGLLDTDADGHRELASAERLELEIKVTSSRPTDMRAAELVTEQLREIGISARPVQLDEGTIEGLFRSRDYDAYITTIGAHGVADPDQFVQSLRSGYLWRSPEVPHAEYGTLIESWMAAEDLEQRRDLSFEMQAVFNDQPTAVPLYYPDVHWAYRPEAFDGFVEARGYGIVHKWSFLPREVAADAHALVES